MKRTVIHTTKQYMQNPFNQPAQLFPFLCSPLLQNYAKSNIKYRKIHAMCNYKNLQATVPLPMPCKQFLFFGRSNVGKSTLLNNLMQKSVAAVSKRPGKTKQLMFCEIGPSNHVEKGLYDSKVYFVDAPGYGFATGVSKTQINQWGKLITNYLKITKINSMNQRFLLLIDVTHDLKQTDALIFQLLKSLNKNFIVIFTKCDKFQCNSQSDQLKKGLQIAQTIKNKYSIMNHYLHFTSCRNGMGVEQLRKHIMFELISDKL